MSAKSTIQTSSPDVIPANPSKQLILALKWSEGVVARDIDAILATLSDKQFEHYILPESAQKALNHPPVRRGKEEFKASMEMILSMMKTLEPTIHEVVDAGDKVVIYSKGTGLSATGHAYASEWQFIFKFEEDTNGSVKIVQIKEFIDSLYMTQFVKAETERITQLKAKTT